MSLYLYFVVSLKALLVQYHDGLAELANAQWWFGLSFFDSYIHGVQMVQCISHFNPYGVFAD